MFWIKIVLKQQKKKTDPNKIDTLKIEDGNKKNHRSSFLAPPSLDDIDEKEVYDGEKRVRKNGPNRNKTQNFLNVKRK